MTERQTIMKVCKCCGKIFNITPRVQQRMEELNFPLPTRCRHCNTMKTIVKDIECKACGKIFSLTEMAAHAMRRKFGEDYREPKYCLPCRITHKTKGGKKK